MKKNNIFKLLPLVLATLLAGCTGNNEAPAKTYYGEEVASVTLNQGSARLQVGEILLLEPLITYKEGATHQDQVEKEWISSNPRVASISEEGVVTALMVGKTSITYVAGYKAAACQIEVYQEVITPEDPDEEFSLSLNATSLSLAVNDEYTLVATMSEEKPMAWYSSDVTVVSVDNGKIKALKAGTATVSVTANDRTASCFVTVRTPEEDEEEKTVTVYFFIDYNNVNKNDTTKTQLLAKFKWYEDRPLGQASEVPADPTTAMDKAFPYFIGWSSHPIIDSKEDLLDLSTYIIGSLSTFYVYGIWADVPKGSFTK